MGPAGAALVVTAGPVEGKVAAGDVTAGAVTAGVLVARSTACVGGEVVMEGGSSVVDGGTGVTGLVEQARANRASKINATSERFFNTCKVIRIKPLSA
jgi:hypothetical protein